MRCLIFANGSFAADESVNLKEADWVIAVDGGIDHCCRLGINPHLVIGDFDSASASKVRQAATKGARIEVYPKDKDQTDLELALLKAAQKGAGEIVVFGALGRRWDMSIANIMLLALPELRSLAVKLVTRDQELHLVAGGNELSLKTERGDLLSLVPLTAEAMGVDARGVKYALQNSNLTFGESRGVSNVCRESEVCIGVKKGLLLCILKRCNAAALNTVDCG